MRVFLIALLLCIPLAGWAQPTPTPPTPAPPNEDEYWVQRIVSAAQVVSARLDHAGRHTALCIRKDRGSMPALYNSFPYGLDFVVPGGAPKTVKVRAARAQAAGIITSAWLRYTAEVNAACIDANQPLKFAKIDGQGVYLKILGD